MINTNNITLTAEEITAAEKFHNFIEREMNGYLSWYEFDREGNPERQRLNVDTIIKVNEFAVNTPVNSIYTTGYYGMTLLHQLVTHNYYDAVKTLLEKGVNPNITGNEGKGDYVEAYKSVTPLHIACHSGNLNMVKLLLEYGADSTVTDDRGRNCFHYLAGNEFDIRSHGDHGKYEFALQCQEIAKLLKCDINAKDSDGCTPFIYLMGRTGRLSVLLTQTFIDLGADVFARDGNGNTTLMLAVINVHITAAKILMEYKELINAQNKDGNTALHIAFLEGLYDNAKIVYMLVKRGADTSITNNAGETVIQFLKKEKEDNSNAEYLEKIILKKRVKLEDYFDIWSHFDTNFWGGEYYDDNVFFYDLARDIAGKIDTDDDTELPYVQELLEKMLWANRGDVALTILHEEGYDLTMKLVDGSQVTTIRDICVEAAWRENINAIEKLIEYGVNMNEPLVDGKTPAFIIVDKIGRNSEDHVYEGCIKALEYCSVESMEQLNNKGMSAVHEVAGYGKRAALIEYMIERGVNINITTDEPAKPGNTPLHIACLNNNVEIVRALKKAGADDSIMNNEEETPAYCLFDDYDRYDSDKARQILELLDNVDTPKAESGETPIIRMFRKNRNYEYEMLEIFLDKGVDLNHADNRGNTPLLMHAQRDCEREVVKLLLSEGADINARNEEGNSALMYAIKNSDNELARYLIKKGADYNILNDRNETPASIAIEKGMEAVLELMTDITVFPVPDEDDEDDDYEDEEEIRRRQYYATVEGYVQVYGREKGIQLANIAWRMSELTQNGINESNMEEYQALAAEVQKIMQKDTTE